jgi:hypothetical protein
MTLILVESGNPTLFPGSRPAVAKQAPHLRPMSEYTSIFFAGFGSGCGVAVIAEIARHRRHRGKEAFGLWLLAFWGMI